MTRQEVIKWKLDALKRRIKAKLNSVLRARPNKKLSRDVIKAAKEYIIEYFSNHKEWGVGQLTENDLNLVEVFYRSNEIANPWFKFKDESIYKGHGVEADVIISTKRVVFAKLLDYYGE